MGDKTKVKKSSKGMTEDPDDRLLPGLDNSAADIECEICGIRFSDANAYEKHMQGKKHQKKVAEAKLVAKHLEAKNAGGQDDKNVEDGEDGEEDLHCEVCDKDFSGYVSYLAHVKGSVHAKNEKKKKLMQKLSGMPDVLNPDDDGGNASDDDGILPKTYARCKTCGKEFGGPESYSMHLRSAAHKKKVKQSKVVQALKDQNGDAEDNSGEEDEFYRKCDVCQKSFSGVVPYKIHMVSGVHKKNLEKQKVAEELKEHYSNDGSDPGYLCKECNKTFTNPLAFKSHIANNSHEKLKAKSALLEFLNAHPEIVIVYPLDKDESGNESDSDGADSGSGYYLICKLCHISFSGPESAQDHVKSKKHVSLKKEKRLKKVLKEQKKNSNPQTADAKSSEKENGKTENSETKSLASNADDFEMI